LSRTESETTTTSTDLLINAVLSLRQTHPPPHYAVVDFDGTIIQGDIGEIILAYLAWYHYPNSEENFCHYHALVYANKMHEAYRFATKVLRGFSPAEVVHITKRAIAEEGSTIRQLEFLGRAIQRGIALRDNIIELLRKLRENGIDIWIVSASPEVAVSTAMKHFGVEANLIAVRSVMDGGVLTEAIEEPAPIFSGKTKCIQSRIHKTVKPLLGIGDGMNDYFMLTYAHLRAVVNPRSVLAAEAIARGWFVLP
jgi:HAD superfamily phosphoserine phosphatase-like hydrolase